MQKSETVFENLLVKKRQKTLRCNETPVRRPFPKGEKTEKKSVFFIFSGFFLTTFSHFFETPNDLFSEDTRVD